MNLFSEPFLNNLFHSCLIIFFSWISYVLITSFTKKILKLGSKVGSKKKSITIMKLINSIFKYIIIILAILMILSEFGFDTKGLIASLGIVGVIAGLALKDVVADLVTGFSIITDNQYAVGDYIKIGDFSGTVIELGLQSTKIKGANGEIKVISNGTITEITNYSKNPMDIYIDIPTSYNEKKSKVEKVLLEICEDLNKNIEYLKSDVELLGIQELADSAIMYRLHAQVDAINQFKYKRAVNGKVREYFDKNKIEIPFNQLVIHNEKWL